MTMTRALLTLLLLTQTASSPAPVKIVPMPETERASIAVIQRDLNGMQARMAQLTVEYTTLKDQLPAKAEELNKALEKAKRDGCEIDTDKLEYKCSDHTTPPGGLID